MSSAPHIPPKELPDRLCTWCKVPMKKRLVGGDQFLHYTCPKCIFQHTTSDTSSLTRFFTNNPHLTPSRFWENLC